MVLQSDLMYPAVGYKHQHNYSHEEEDYYAQDSYNYSSMQMVRPKPGPTSNFMISSSQPSECHVAMAPADGYFGHHDHRNNKDKYYESKEKFYEEFNVKGKYQDGYGHHDDHNKEKFTNGYSFKDYGRYDSRNKDRFSENKEKFNEDFSVKEKYQDGYGRYDSRNKDKFSENKEKFNEDFSVKEKYQDGYGRYDNRNKDKYSESKERFNEGFNFKEKEKYQDGYGYKDSSDDHYYGHGHNGGKHQEGFKFSIDKLVGGSGGYGAETHFVTPHIRRRPFDHEKMMGSWELKSIDD